MLTVVSDTHSEEGHRLTGRTLAAVREADLVVHAGDFYTESALDAFYEAADTLRAVSGNNATAAVRDRLPSERVVEYAGVRVAVTHTRRGGSTALALFGREREADAVVFGHSHRPTVEAADGLTLLNPGSHAQPRGNRKAHAELVPDGDGLDGRLVTTEGTVFERFRVEPRRVD